MRKDRRWPQRAAPRILTEREIALLPVAGKLAEVVRTWDRFEDMGIGYRMVPVPPGGPGWRIYDSSHDHKTTWCRDVFLIVEVQS